MDAAQEDGSMHDETAGGITEDHADAAALASHREELAAAIAQLPEQQQQYIALRFVHGLSNAEAARRLGVSPNTPWNAARFGGRDRLRELLTHLEAA
jgi:DNA-directed RNA polymerase specialized sigma24 family protein